MPHRQPVFARSLQTVMALIVTVSLHANLFAADKKPVTAPKPGQRNLKLPGGKQLEPHLPLKPETKAEKAHREALAWYMQGRLREASGDFRKAYTAYQKAAKIEPKAISIYRALVPLAFGLGKQAEGVKYAFKAIELDPNDYKLLRQLGVFMAAQNKIPQAAKLLEQATQSKTIDKSSIIYVTLMRDLAILYSGLLTRDKESTELKKKAADAYFVVFDARVNPKKYKLNDATQRRLETDPISSFERIGTAFLTASRPNLAIRAFEAAQKERKGKPGSLSFNLAQVYHQTKQNQKAMKHLQLYFDAQLQTKGKAAYALLSDILKAQGQSKSLVGKLEAISKKDRKNSVLQFYLAEQYVAAKQLKKAETLFRSALKVNESSAGRIGLAAIHREQNQSTQWLQELATVLRGASSSRELDTRYQTIEPEVTAAVENKAFTKSLISTGTKRVTSKKNPLKFEESFILGQLAAEAKQTKQAVAFYEFSLQTKPSMAGTIYEEWGGHLLVVSKYKESVVIFRKAVTDVALSGQKPNFLFRLSQAEESAGNTKAALAAIREAQQIIPNIAFLHYQEGWIYYHARQWDKAIPLFEGVISRFATDRRIVKQCRFSLSNIYVQQGNRRKGEQILEQVYAEDPEDPSVNNDLGYLYAERGKKLEQAEKMIRKALKAEPKNAAYMDSMGWVLYMRKKYTEALPYLEKSAKDPSGGDATIWDHLGDCYNQLKKSKEAKESWQKALKSAEAAKSPDKKLIKKIKAKLKP
jgi:tetratricopeptide (TPR) repeat protein